MHIQRFRGHFKKKYRFIQSSGMVSHLIGRLQVPEARQSVEDLMARMTAFLYY